MEPIWMHSKTDWFGGRVEPLAFSDTALPEFEGETPSALAALLFDMRAAEERRAQPRRRA